MDFDCRRNQSNLDVKGLRKLSHFEAHLDVYPGITLILADTLSSIQLCNSVFLLHVSFRGFEQQEHGLLSFFLSLFLTPTVRLVRKASTAKE